MNTGDSMYISPFVPHTFSSRKNEAGELGLILALTYNDKLAGETQQELSAIGLERATQYALDFSTREKAAGSLLRTHREAASLDYQELARRTRIHATVLADYERGETLPSAQNLECIASALRVTVRDLLPPPTIEKKVIVSPYQSNQRWNFPHHDPAYGLVELAGTSHLPHSKALELTVLKPVDGEIDSTNLDLKLNLHQYVYNLDGLVDGSPVDLTWYSDSDGKNYRETIQPGDSAYIKPFVPHNFRGIGGKLLVLRIGGRAAGEPQRELSLMGKENAGRAVAETIPWFDKAGKSKV